MTVASPFTLRRLLAVALAVALTAALLPAPAHASTSTLTTVQAREALEQLLMTMNNDARQNPKRWYPQATEPAVSPIPAWSDLIEPQRSWSRRLLQVGPTICANGAPICHNVPPIGPDFGEVNCCWQTIGENISMHSTASLTPDAIETMAEEMTRSLMHSDGHRANIMRPGLDDFGVGVSSAPGPHGRTSFIATFIFRTRVETPSGARVDTWGPRFTAGLTRQQITNPTPRTTPVIAVSDLTAVCRVARHRSEFRDVPAHHPHARGIECASHTGLAHGRTDGGFAPGVILNRGQAASLVARLLEQLGAQLPEPRQSFTDVPASHAHARTIGQLAALGVAAGRTDGTYRPHDTVTRAQFASLVDRSLAEANANYRQLRPTGDYFVDDNGSVHEVSMNRLASRGVLAGPRDSVIEPGTPVSRGEAATITARALDTSQRSF